MPNGPVSVQLLVLPEIKSFPGPIAWIVFIPFYLLRVRAEERMMFYQNLLNPKGLQDI
jgi:hypothetical protein